jgi:tripartite-type tricarboxylate transporter receptor subunit TctC
VLHEPSASDHEGRHFLQLATGAASIGLFPSLPRLAAADDYPTRPVHVIGPTPAGGSPDIIARVVGQYLSEKLAQPFFVDDRTGASGNIATEYVVKSPPDGYTLLVAISSNAINATLFNNLNFNFIRDTTPDPRHDAGRLFWQHPPRRRSDAVVPGANPSGVHRLSESQSGQGHHGVGGHRGSGACSRRAVLHDGGREDDPRALRGEGLALPDVMSGQINMIFGAMPASLGYIKGGKLRPLAVTARTRQAVLPDVPTSSEFLPGYEASGWYGMVAPKATPREIVDKLNTEVNAALADPVVKSRLSDLGLNLAPGSQSSLPRKPRNGPKLSSLPAFSRNEPICRGPQDPAHDAF